MKTVLTKAELAERWSVDVRTIDRIEGIPVPRYSVEHIQSIEGIKNLNHFSPLERKRLEIELEKLRAENEKLRAVLSNILSESAKVVGI